MTPEETPSWPGKPQVRGFVPLPEDYANDWVYTSWKDKLWFCTVYNGVVDVSNLRNKEDVARVVFKNNFLEGMLNSPICGRKSFFFDEGKNICGVEIDCKPSEQDMPAEYLDDSKINLYKKYLEYLVREEK